METLMPAYPAHILAYYQNLTYAGVWPESEADVLTVQVGSLSAGEILQLQVKIHDQQISDVCYQILGCPYAIACSEYLAGWLMNKKIADLHFSVQKIITDLQLPSFKQHCALLAEDAVIAIKQQLRA
jgi:nitrogen fixation NifU-like protein